MESMQKPWLFITFNCKKSFKLANIILGFIIDFNNDSGQRMILLHKIKLVHNRSEWIPLWRKRSKNSVDWKSNVSQRSHSSTQSRKISQKVPQQVCSLIVSSCPPKKYKKNLFNCHSNSLLTSILTPVSKKLSSSRKKKFFLNFKMAKCLLSWSSLISKFMLP